MKPVTIWRRFNSKTQKYEHNHIEEGLNFLPIPVADVDTVNELWQSSKWEKKYGYQDDENKITPVGIAFRTQLQKKEEPFSHIPNFEEANRPIDLSEFIQILNIIHELYGNIPVRCVVSGSAYLAEEEHLCKDLIEVGNWENKSTLFIGNP